MKRSRAACCGLKLGRLIRCWGWAALAAFFALHAPCAVAHHALTIKSAQFILADSAVPPPKDAAWQNVSLPHKISKPDGRDLVGCWYRATFDLPAARDQLYLYLPTLHTGGTISVNGYEVGRIRDADALRRNRSFQPHMVLVPWPILNSGSNVVTLHFNTREPLISLSPFSIGPESELRDRFNAYLFWQYTTAEISAVVCSMLGVLIVIFWLRRRQEKLYGVFGLCVFFWGMRTYLARIEVVPMAYWTEWRSLYYLSTGGFIVFMTIFLLMFCGLRRPGFLRALLAYWLVGCVVFAVIGAPARKLMDLIWLSGLLPFALFAVVHLMRCAYRERTLSAIAMSLAIVPTLGFTLHDHAMVQGLFYRDEFYLMHLGIPAFLMVMCWVMSNHFLDSLQQVESSNEHLQQRIAAREKELQASFDDLRKLESERAVREERQRIIEDMHDGLGSQILSTIVMVQRGSIPRQTIVQLLHECLDDMRLVIEAIGQQETDFLAVLGNFRFRMESRFKNMGIALNWRYRDMPDALAMGPHATLHLLRILQESLANVLKHAKASRVDVEIAFGADHILISIQDDGDGFVENSTPGSRGIANMEMRAKRLGAELTIEHPQSGTKIRLRVPIARNSVLAAVD